MNVFSSSFDLFRIYAEALASDPSAHPTAPPPAHLPEVPSALRTANDAPLVESADAHLPWDGLEPMSDVARTEFGDVGGNGDSFYFFDPDTGSSVML